MIITMIEEIENNEETIKHNEFMMDKMRRDFNETITQFKDKVQVDNTSKSKEEAVKQAEENKSIVISGLNGNISKLQEEIKMLNQN